MIDLWSERAPLPCSLIFESRFTGDPDWEFLWERFTIGDGANQRWKTPAEITEHEVLAIRDSLSSEVYLDMVIAYYAANIICCAVAAPEFGADVIANFSSFLREPGTLRLTCLFSRDEIQAISRFLRNWAQDNRWENLAGFPSTFSQWVASEHG